MFNLPFFKKTFKLNPVVLVVMDGFGIAPPSEGNAITLANTSNYDQLIRTYPHGELIASGESVGLPTNEVGNTEVGHLTLGAGRVIPQDLKKINNSIENGKFYDNKAFVQMASHAKLNNSKVHILGLLSSGNVHSSENHLYAMLQFCKKEGLNNVYMHIFTDGRDAPPRQSVEIVEKLERHLEVIKIGQIASISGRYYAMDRDRRWERTEKAYRAICLGQGIETSSAVNGIKEAYTKGQTDEFIEPTVVVGRDGAKALVQDNDCIVFFNYRVDRPRQLTMAFVLPDFENLKAFDFGYSPETSREEGKVEITQTFMRQKVLNNLFFVTMTEYHKNLPVSAVAFPPEIVDLPLGKVISDLGLRQLHMSESEKERFVTYYFDGMNEHAFPGEDWDIVPSPKVPTYDKKPEMALPGLVKAFKHNLRKDIYSFIVINFANPDMVAHTGDIKATIEAINHVDKYLQELINAVLAQNGTVVITADHGNAEELLTYPSHTYFYTSQKGVVNTDHSNNPVPVIIIKKGYENSKLILRGALADISPTILGLMNLKIPSVMTGNNLLSNNNTSGVQSM